MAAMRRCAAPRCPHLVPAGTRHCPPHAREHEQRRGSRQSRGYDAAHDRLRARWQALLDQGRLVRCRTCGDPIDPKAWDLGHTEDRSGYIGPQCVPCNRGHRYPTKA